MSAHAATADGHHAGGASASAYHESLLRSPVFLGMVMFLGSEIMLFGSFFTIFFYIRFTHTAWPPTGIDLPVEATGIKGPDGGAMPSLKHHVTVTYTKKGGKWWAVAVRPVIYAPPPGGAPAH